MPGLFITFEGTEGSGKSTQIRSLAERLQQLGCEVVVVREPGGTPVGEEIRHLIKHSTQNVSMCPEAELLLMNASRAQLVREVIRPALSREAMVLCDRFADSTIAYQAFGRQLELSTVQKVIDIAVGETRPDLTLLLRIPLELSEQRRLQRGSTERDRMEEQERDFFLRVEKGYDEIAAAGGSRVRTVDATQSVERVGEEIWKWVEPLVTVPPVQGERAWKSIGEYRQTDP